MSAHGRVARAAVGGKPEDVRRHNLGTLLAHLHQSGRLSRAELTARMGLNRSTIAGLVSQLAELGLVEEGPPTGGRVGVGRPSLVVSTRGDTVQVVAADIGVDRVVVALVGLGGRVVARRQRRFSRAPSARAATQMIVRLVESLQGEVTGRVVGIGVALPGVIRQQDGLVRFAPNLGWVDEPLGELLRDRLGRAGHRIRIQVANDADLGVLAEHLRGAAVGHDDVVFIAGEAGVGGGCIIEGRPLHGAGGYAGELGHLPLVPGGRACRCGSRGCWETEIGGVAVARALGLPPVPSDAVVHAVREVAARGGTELAGVARFLGRGLAGVVNLLNPQLVIIAGLLGDVFSATEPLVREALDASALSAPADQVRLTRPLLGGDAVLLGAAELAWQELITDPAGLLGAARWAEVGARG